MNIFIVDKDPTSIASALPDKLIVKMPLETLQMIAVGASKFYPNTPVLKANGYPYQLTHVNHPCTKWVCESIENFYWTIQLCRELCLEYRSRYNKIGAIWNSINRFVDDASIDLTVIYDQFLENLSLPPRAMPVCYHTQGDISLNDIVDDYRDYMIFEKSYYATWNHSTKPDWWEM